MKAELLYIPDCPNTQRVRRLLKRALRELGLSPEIDEIEVTDSSQADMLHFPGSPTIRIDGTDVDEKSPRQDGDGLCCRTYLIDGRLRGLPTQEIVRIAIRSAVSRAAMEARSR